MNKSKLIKVTKQGKLDLPSEVLVNFQPGDEYIIWQQEDTIILKKVDTSSNFSDLWQKIDELGEDTNQPSTEEIVAIVKKVRNKLRTND